MSKELLGFFVVAILLGLILERAFCSLPLKFIRRETDNRIIAKAFGIACKGLKISLVQQIQLPFFKLTDFAFFFFVLF